MPRRCFIAASQPTCDNDRTVNCIDASLDSFLTLNILKVTVLAVDAISANTKSAADVAHFVREQIPPGGLFAGLDWRISPEPFPLGENLAKEIESLGRVLLQFYRAVNLLYRRSVEGKQPAWIAELLDRGKPPGLIELQRSPAFKNDVPRVIRPDILLTENGFSITELDSVPGGIGLTAWLNQTYSRIAECGVRTTGANPDQSEIRNPKSEIIGGADGMIRGFESIFGDAKQVHIIVSEEAATYRPEMEWMAEPSSKFKVQQFKIQNSTDFADGDAVYRFFELFDLANVPNSKKIFELAAEKRIRLTPPPKPVFEEKMLFALLWNRNLRDFWRRNWAKVFWRGCKN